MKGRLVMTPEISKERIYKYDTIRALLIFCVIVGHSMEQFFGPGINEAYKVIYSFHMPVFLYITGRFAKFDRKKIAKHLILPYFVFQTLYLFAMALLNGEPFSLQFTTPYWLLWYLFAVILYYIIIPMLPEKDSRGVIITILGSILIAVSVGYMDTIGYYLSLSRFLVFLPFFLFGYYYDELKSIINTKWGIFLSLIIIILGEFVLCSKNVPNGALYCSMSYAACKSSAQDRVLIIILASFWIVLFENTVPEKKIPYISAVGQNTMLVFLMHGFIMRIAGKITLFHFSKIGNVITACLLAIVLIAILGNKYINKLFKYMF